MQSITQYCLYTGIQHSLNVQYDWFIRDHVASDKCNVPAKTAKNSDGARHEKQRFLASASVKQRNSVNRRKKDYKKCHFIRKRLSGCKGLVGVKLLIVVFILFFNRLI